jgi:hypothetical protein
VVRSITIILFFTQRTRIKRKGLEKLHEFLFKEGFTEEAEKIIKLPTTVQRVGVLYLKDFKKTTSSSTPTTESNVISSSISKKSCCPEPKEPSTKVNNRHSIFKNNGPEKASTNVNYRNQCKI